jgi:hypothetical protein
MRLNGVEVTTDELDAAVRRAVDVHRFGNKKRIRAMGDLVFCYPDASSMAPRNRQRVVAMVKELRNGRSK